MTRFKNVAMFVLALMAFPAFASELTPDEQAMLQEMRATAKKQGITLTPEMEQMALDSARRVQAQALGLQVGAQRSFGQGSRGSQERPSSIQSGVRSPSASPVSSELVQATQAQQSTGPEHSRPTSQYARPTKFEDLRDGFKANGRPWLDPEGPIERYAFNPATGDVTYLVKRGDGRLLVKHANANGPDAPMLMGQLIKQQDSYEYEGVDGQILSAPGFVLTDRGLFGHRPGSLFYLEFGEKLKPYATPEGFKIAPWQTGDVSGTGFILMYRRKDDGGFIRYASSTLGKNSDSDMLFFNLHTGTTIPVMVSGHKIKDGPNRYEDTGLHDDDHIYWRARWYATSNGPIAVVKEDGPSRLTVINLETGTRATAFERRAGLGDWDLNPDEHGRLRLEGSWAFKKHVIEDVSALLNN